MAPQLIGAVGYGLCALLFFGLFFRLLIYARSQRAEQALTYAVFMTAVWACANAVMFYKDSVVFFGWVSWTEVTRNAAWFYCLLVVFGSVQAAALPLLKRWVWGGKLVLLGQFILSTLLVFVFDTRFISVFYFINVLFSVSMLVLVEQLLRNASQAQRWQVKFFGVACLLLFGFDFLLYSQSVLKGQIQPSWLQARGAVTTLAAPLVFLYSTRQRRVPRLMAFSHKLVFHSSVLLVASAYLILTAIAGYYFKNFGGGWGEFLRIFVMAGGLVGLVLLLFSGAMRARLWVFISRHILPFQYDYREEWLKVTRSLSEATALWPLTRKIVALLGDCVESTGGAIWVCNESQRLVLINNGVFTFPEVHTSRDLDALMRYWQEGDRIVLIPELLSDVVLARRVNLPTWMLRDGLAWLLIPLKAQNTLQGFVLLAEPRTEISLNWENFDYLRVVASQAAVQLAVARASEQLATTQRFEAVHQMSAFFVHDLKTMVSQLSMMSKNAHRHISNPAFIEDMLSTVDHAVSKMQRILQHLQSADLNQRLELVDVVVLMRDMVASVLGEPQPQLSVLVPSATVRAERSALRSALMNLIVNAQEAVRERAPDD
ncbi:MAG: PEP-CTERM system histidine kinase PrsK, partial [Gammaproteobacteria bacterium]